MTRTILTYPHSRHLFSRNEFKPFVNKYFKDVKFLGCNSGNYFLSISVSNWNEVKDILFKSYRPLEIKEENK